MLCFLKVATFIIPKKYSEFADILLMHGSLVNQQAFAEKMNQYYTHRKENIGKELFFGSIKMSTSHQPLTKSVGLTPM